jgi:Ca2+-binding RTX toxin-like protein
MAAIITLGTGAWVGEAVATPDYCPEPPLAAFDFEDAWTDECPVCSIADDVLTCTFPNADSDNQLTIIEGFATSYEYSVFGVYEDDVFCCTYNDEDGDSGDITAIVVEGSDDTDLLAFRFPFATGTWDLSPSQPGSHGITATLNGGDDADHLYGSDDSSGAGSYEETLNGEGGADTINGNNGDDDINGGAGVDVISGGAGDDVIDGGTEGDTLHGDGDDDHITGGTGDDVLWGGTGDDTLQGEGDADVLCGGGQADTLQSNDGYDQMYGYGGYLWSCTVGGTTIDDGSWTSHSGPCTVTAGKPTACP